MYKLLINTKAYAQSMGNEFKELLEACDDLKEEAKVKNVEIILVPQLPELKDSILKNITTYSQHVDSVLPGSHTGMIPPKNVKLHGANGTLLNHSERTLSKKKLTTAHEQAKLAELITCVCAKSPQKIKSIVPLSPDIIGFEPPELIGGDVSVTTKPKSILKAVKFANGIPLLVGAGIKNRNDVSKALELGASGVLVASGIVKAKDKKKAIEELLEGFST